MKRIWIASLLTLAACVPQRQPAPQVSQAAPAVCRAAPDGSRPVADRGIGGTGAPAVETAERGIGGTGVIGVVTGFASVCVAGQEVALPPGVPMLVDGEPAQLDDLRVGQLVALQAAGPLGALQARQIAIQHAVIGPVQTVGTGTMTVAGQFVFVNGAVGAAVGAKVGDWVAVSGLMQGGETIAATRIDPAPPGRVLVRGELISSYGTARIGALMLRLPLGPVPPAGWPVIATGRLVDGVLYADAVVRDLAAEGPAAYFGPAVSTFVVESYIAGVAGGFLVNREFVAGTGLVRDGRNGRGIATFSRGAGGRLEATGLQFGNGGGGGGFAPAPMPQEGPQGGAGLGRSGSGGFGGRGGAGPAGGGGFAPGGYGFGGNGLEGPRR